MSREERLLENLKRTRKERDKALHQLKVARLLREQGEEAESLLKEIREILSQKGKPAEVRLELITHLIDREMDGLDLDDETTPEGAATVLNSGVPLLEHDQRRRRPRGRAGQTAPENILAALTSQADPDRPW
ncbi:MAG TPA: hypothetical protein VH682_24625 [Gemmataceae bacterium]|jgi:hypothetical protein